MSRNVRIGMWMVVLITLSYTGIEINGAVDHLHHATWDRHANFHAVSGLLWLLTLFIVNFILLWRFAKQAESWALWTIAFIGLGIFGGAVASDPLTDGGLRLGETALATGEIAYWSGWAALAGWELGVLLMRSHARKSHLVTAAGR
jgi:hypothetical protein